MTGGVPTHASPTRVAGGATRLRSTSGSAEEFVSQFTTLKAIAGHTDEVLGEVAASAAVAQPARAEADAAQAAAQRTLDDVTARQARLEADIVDYQARYDALSATQQQEVGAAHAGQAVTAAPAATASGVAQAAVDTALAQVGDAYVERRWAGRLRLLGADQYAYAAAGISLPHSSRMQATMGAAVSRADLQPGDLIFYDGPVSHVPTYIGNSQMVHASTAGQPVDVVSVDSTGGITAIRCVPWATALSAYRPTPRPRASRRALSR